MAHHIRPVVFVRSTDRLLIPVPADAPGCAPIMIAAGDSRIIFARVRPREHTHIMEQRCKGDQRFKGKRRNSLFCSL